MAERNSYSGVMWAAFALALIIFQTSAHGGARLLLAAALLILGAPCFLLAAKYGGLAKRFKELGKTNE